MTYRVYIKKDYKTETGASTVRSRRKKWVMLSGFTLVLIAICLRLTLSDDPIQDTLSEVIPESKGLPVYQAANPLQITGSGQIALDARNTLIAATFSQAGVQTSINASSDVPIVNLESSPAVAGAQATDNRWQRVTVKTGDSLALIFARLGLSPRSLYEIMLLGKETSRLKKIRPGQILNFRIDANALTALEYAINPTHTLSITKQEGMFQATLVHEELTPRVKQAKVVIRDSLFLSGKRAGLSANLIMQLASIYAWDIDFALDIREGDSFTLLYEERYKDGVKVGNDTILAAEFVNRNTPLRTFRYVHADGRIDYYADNGDAMRKAFLRMPVALARISSRFNLKRKHPILNKIRAHKGVDYAAPTGTPVKATGDGTVTLVGNKGGYGKTVILRHGQIYSTLYAHLHKYARGVRKGKRVKQGQIIGYVGKSGLATGPHLHYEFRVKNVHRDPLKVKLPKAESINKDDLPKFLQAITPMMAALDRLTGERTLVTQQTDNAPKQLSALMEDG